MNQHYHQSDTCVCVCVCVCVSREACFYFVFLYFCIFWGGVGPTAATMAGGISVIRQRGLNMHTNRFVPCVGLAERSQARSIWQPSGVDCDRLPCSKETGGRILSSDYFVICRRRVREAWYSNVIAKPHFQQPVRANSALRYVILKSLC